MQLGEYKPSQHMHRLARRMASKKGLPLASINNPVRRPGRNAAGDILHSMHRMKTSPNYKKLLP